MVKTLTSTNATLLLNANNKRKKVTIQMQPTAVDSNNTGKIYVAANYQPIATIGHASQGEVLIQGASIEQPRAGEPISEKWKGQVWATSDTANQTLIVEEEVEI